MASNLETFQEGGSMKLIKGSGKFWRGQGEYSDVMSTTPLQEMLDGPIMDPNKTRKRYTPEHKQEVLKFWCEITCTRQQGDFY